MKTNAPVISRRHDSNPQRSEAFDVIEQTAIGCAINKRHVARRESASEGLLDQHEEGRRTDTASEHDQVLVTLQLWPAIP
jgi:hypothetical protein